MKIDPNSAVTWLVVFIGGGLIVKILWDWLSNSSLKQKVEIIDRENRGEHRGMRAELKEFKTDVKADIGRLENAVSGIGETVTSIYRDMPKRGSDA